MKNSEKESKPVPESIFPYVVLLAVLLIAVGFIIIVALDSTHVAIQYNPYGIGSTP
jgi:hypothetical protein